MSAPAKAHQDHHGHHHESTIPASHDTNHHQHGTGQHQHGSDHHAGSHYRDTHHASASTLTQPDLRHAGEDAHQSNTHQHTGSTHSHDHTHDSTHHAQHHGRLANKIAIITGSSSGIGRAMALEFAREGAHIVCSDVKETARTEHPEKSSGTTTAEIEKLGMKSMFVKCDVSDESQVKALVERGVKEFGRVDIMVNNAGIIHDAIPVWDLPTDTWDKTISINLRGVFLGTKYAAKAMKEQAPGPSGDRGWIVNVASILGLSGTKGLAAYVSAKHGVMGFTKTAAWDCAEWRVHVNAICPGYTSTSMIEGITSEEKAKQVLEKKHAFHGLGSAEEIAKATVFLASEDASWVSGIGLPVDGAYTAGTSFD